MEPETSMPGQCGCDRDTFLRVWRRVKPEDTPDSPILVEDAPAPPEPAAAIPAGPADAVQPPVRAMDGAGDDFPNPHDVPCLGTSSAHHAPILQELIERALGMWRAYQVLARRAAGGAGRMLSALAAEQRQAAKRLSTALFLITGLHYWPVDQASAAVPASYQGALREHFLAEQRQEETYRAAAEDCQDPCLCALYIDLAGLCASRAARLRALLETL